MVNYCVVALCHTEGGHRFPTNVKIKRKWINFVNLKRKSWKWTPNSVLCNKHFRAEDFVDQATLTKRGTPRKNKILKDAAVPSVFQIQADPAKTCKRRRSRLLCDEVAETEILTEKDDDIIYMDSDFTVAEHQEISDAISICSSSVPLITQSVETSAVTDDTCITFLNNRCETVEVSDSDDDVEIRQEKFVPKPKLLNTSNTNDASDNELNNLLFKQHLFSQPYLSIDRIKYSCKDCLFYTGLESYSKFLTVFHSLGPNVNLLKSVINGNSIDSVNPETAFLLMLVYLRLHYSFFELSNMFSLSEFTVRNICYTWVTFCARQWQEIDLWTPRCVTDHYLPHDFKLKYPNTRLIIDGTEIPIHRPSNPTAQRTTFSTYKHKNTVKVLVGATPGGQVSFISEAYGGSASDRQIVERSDLISKMDRGDAIMADKGFNVQDMFMSKDVKINMPSFFKKKNRMTPDEVAEDRRVSSKRVHIERIIGNTKSYKILKSTLSASETHLASEIIFVCFMLNNFRNNIVSVYA